MSRCSSRPRGARRATTSCSARDGNGIDGAHILTPMPYLIPTGKVTQNNQPAADVHPGAAQSRRQAISVANEYAGPEGRPRRLAAEGRRSPKKKAAGKEVKVAMTFPGGTHDLWIRYWLAAGGIDPDKDVSTIVVPPPQMVANMKVGTMDALLRRRAVERAARQPGHRLHRAARPARSGTGHPEKALGMRADWVDKNPNAAKALLMAVMEAQQWCDKHGEQGGDGRRSSASASGSTCRCADIIGRIKGDINYGNGRRSPRAPTL